MQTCITLILAMTLFSWRAAAQDLYPPIVEVAKVIITAPEGIDVSCNGTEKHVSSWSEAFHHIGDTISSDFNKSLEQQGFKVKKEDEK